MNEFDLAVIGAGTGGLVSAFLADGLGVRVALIEKERVGGECLWTGCVPSKTLIQSARVYNTVKNATEFGVRAENPRVIWNAVKLRIADVRDDIKKLERDELAKSKIEIISGAARFEDGSTLRVQSKSGEQTIRAKKFILATGSKTRIPKIEGLAESGFITHTDVYTRPSLPRSLVIIGGGPIACEMAQALTRLDCKVTVLQRGSTLLEKEDAEVSALAGKMLEQDGATIFCDAEIQSVHLDGEKKRVSFHQNGEEQSVSAGEILVAIGKEIDLSELNIEATGARWSTHGVEVDDYLRAAPNMWACGDVTGGFLFTHVAEAQGKIAAQNALLPVGKKWDARVVPWTTFTDPEIARVGLTEEEARREYSDVKIFQQEFSKLDRAIIEGETRGFTKVVTTGSGRILGAHIVGPRAGELIHPFVCALQNNGLIQEFAETIFVYPTLSEIAHRAGNAFYQELLGDLKQSKWTRGVLKKVIGKSSEPF
jgi:pyruvate/2-oxoglutarate dehydrogenase complex dihydrolipoamide dehydrogenase (E3) component